jgi:uncharacterized membrane protein
MQHLPGVFEQGGIAEGIALPIGVFSAVKKYSVGDYVATFFSFLGLAIPAVAVLLELNHAISLGQMLVMLVAAVCSFWIGRIVEGYFRNA